MKTISTSNRWDLIALYVNFVLCSNNTYLFNKHFISDAQGKYSTFNAMSEWAEPVNKENGLAYIICGGVVMYV